MSVTILLKSGFANSFRLSVRGFEIITKTLLLTSKGQRILKINYEDFKPDNYSIKFLKFTELKWTNKDNVNMKYEFK